MALVTITGSAWDGDLEPIPAVNEPELWFRPLATSTARGLLTDREIPAKAFSPVNGSFTVELESQPGLMYIPIITWLKNPQDPKNRARGQAEWEPFFPGEGGPIDQLPGKGNAIAGIWHGFGNPPESLMRRDDVVYVDISGLPNGKPVLWLDLRFLIGGSA